MSRARLAWNSGVSNEPRLGRDAVVEQLLHRRAQPRVEDPLGLQHRLRRQLRERWASSSASATGSVEIARSPDPASTASGRGDARAEEEVLLGAEQPGEERPRRSPRRPRRRGRARRADPSGTRPRRSARDRTAMPGCSRARTAGPFTAREIGISIASIDRTRVLASSHDPSAARDVDVVDHRPAAARSCRPRSNAVAGAGEHDAPRASRSVASSLPRPRGSARCELGVGGVAGCRAGSRRDDAVPGRRPSTSTASVPLWRCHGDPRCRRRSV